MAVSVIVNANPGVKAWTIAIVDGTMQTNQSDQLVGYIGIAPPGANIQLTASDQMAMDDNVRAQFSAVSLSLSDDNSGNWNDRVIPQMNRISYLFTEQLPIADSVIALPSDIKRQFTEQLVMSDSLSKTAVALSLVLSDSMNFWQDGQVGVYGHKVSQVPVLVAAHNNPNGRMSQEPILVAAHNNPNGRVSQEPILVAARNSPNGHISQVVVQVIGQRPRQPKIWISS